jgi:hypothetical protein
MDIEPSGTTSPKQRKDAADERRGAIREAFRSYGGLWDLIAAAIAAKDWEALGLSAEAWWRQEIADAWVLAIDDDRKIALREQVQVLLDAGISLRRSADMLGISRSRASRAITGSTGHETRKEVVGQPESVPPLPLTSGDGGTRTNSNHGSPSSSESSPSETQKPFTRATASCPWFGDEDWHRRARQAVEVFSEVTEKGEHAFPDGSRLFLLRAPAPIS